eukprot:478352-Pyramimonas_sp.AAC.2
MRYAVCKRSRRMLRRASARRRVALRRVPSAVLVSLFSFGDRSTLALALALAFITAWVFVWALCLTCVELNLRSRHGHCRIDR